MDEPNGLSKPHMASRLGNGKATLPPKRRSVTRRTSTWRSWTLNWIARIAIWYAIITVLLRCPSTLEDCDDDTPKICSAYFHTKAAVAPRVAPYYDAYAAPYVDRAAPYASSLQTNVLRPAGAVLERYAAPRLQQARIVARERWAATGQPQVERLRDGATDLYQERVGPHVERVKGVLAPYAGVAREGALRTYYEVVLPGYEAVRPYAVSGWDMGCEVTTEKVVPSVVWAFNTVYTFLDGHVWPHVSALYLENVEPQLVRIGERLGRYKGEAVSETPKKSVPPSPEPKTSSFVKPPPAKVTQAKAETTSVKTESTEPTQSTQSRTSVAPPSPSAAEAQVKAETAHDNNNDVEVQAEKPPSKPPVEERIRLASEIVADDLHQWQTKFTTAADEGAAIIEEKVDDISASMYTSHVEGKGRALVEQLDRTVEEELGQLRAEIIALATSQQDREAAKEAAVAAVRRAGLAIKHRAEAVRAWREAFEQEIQDTVTAAAQEHFTILGNMRDLALQKIGMKWAWMDGVTYKDWAKYHELKKKFDRWTEELQERIVANPRLARAVEAAADLEDGAMEIAGEAAVELKRLRDVAGWKIEAGDGGESFDGEEMRAAAERAKDAEQSGDGSDGSPTEEKEDVVDTAPEAVPEPVVEEEDHAVPEFIADQGDSDEAPPPLPVEEDIVQEHVSEVEKSTDPETGNVPIANEQSEAEPEAIPELVDDEEQTDADVDQPIILSPPEDSSEEKKEDLEATPEVMPLFPGAAAEAVPNQHVLEDDAVEDEREATAQAEEDYSSAMSSASEQYSSAASAVSEDVAGEVTPGVGEGLLEEVVEGYSRAVEKASAELSEALVAAHSGVAAGLEDGEDIAAAAVREQEGQQVDEQADEQGEGVDEDEGLLWSEKGEATQREEL